MRVRFPRLFYALTKYYVGVALVLLIAFALHPHIREFLPIGGVEELITNQVEGPFDSVEIGAADGGALGSFVWLIIAIAGALLAALPVSWTYIAIRTRDEYNQSLIQTIILLPVIVTGIVIVVHNSLALAFSLAGIAAGVQFRNALKSTGDALFIFLSIGIGLSAGIGAVELAFVVTIAFNYGFLVLYMYDYGAREGTQRYMRRKGERWPEGEVKKRKKKKKERREAIEGDTPETAPDEDTSAATPAAPPSPGEKPE